MSILLGIILFMVGAWIGGMFVNIFDKNNTSLFKFLICCPHCKHKFKLVDSIPIFSYILSDGKCKYCGESIGIKSLIVEICTGLLFAIGFFSLGINIYALDISKIIKIIEFFCICITLLLIGNIDKKSHRISKKALLFGIVTEALIYLYYYCNNEMLKSDYYRYILYLVMAIALFVLDIVYQKRIAENSYIIEIILLLTYIITSIEYELFICVLVNTIILSLFNLLFNRVDYIKNDSTDILQEVEKKKISVGFWICISTIIICIVENFLMYVL